MERVLTGCRYCIIEVMRLCTLLQIYTHVQGQDNFFWHGPLLLHTWGREWEVKERDGTGLCLCVCFVFNFVPRLGTCVWWDAAAAAYKHSLYLVLYKYMYKMRVNPLG